jgi:hypothetical protein
MENISVQERKSFTYAVYLPTIIRVIKSRGRRWVGHVARMEERKVFTGFWCGSLRKSEHLEDPGVNERIILK